MYYELFFELAIQCVANWKGYIMAGFELIDGEEERQFYKDVRIGMLEGVLLSRS